MLTFNKVNIGIHIVCVPVLLLTGFLFVCHLIAFKIVQL